MWMWTSLYFLPIWNQCSFDEPLLEWVVTALVITDVTPSCLCPYNFVNVDSVLKNLCIPTVPKFTMQMWNDFFKGSLGFVHVCLKKKKKMVQSYKATFSGAEMLYNFMFLWCLWLHSAADTKAWSRPGVSNSFQIGGWIAFVMPADGHKWCHEVEEDVIHQITNKHKQFFSHLATH